MATVTRSSIGNLHEKLSVTITKEDYAPAFEKALKNFSKNANLPGFRKGNVPAGMVKKMYGKSILIDEILRTANKELDTYLQAEKPSIFAQPLAMPLESLDVDVNNLGEYVFDFEIGLKPEFTVPSLDNKGALSRYEIKIEDKLIDEEVKNIQRRAGKVENPDTLEEDMDIIYADLTTEGKEKVEDVVSLDKLATALAAEFKGKNVGHSFTFKPKAILTEAELIDFAKNSVKVDVAEFTDDTEYTMTLTKVGRLVARELDETLFADVFPGQEVKTEEEFRAKLTEEVKKEGARITNEKLQNDIFETLIHETPIELPVEFLKSWIKRGGENVKTDEEVEKEYPSFEHQLIWTLVSDKLIQEYKLEVSMDEVMADLKSKIQTYFGIVEGGEEPEWMEEYITKMAQDQKTLEEAYRRLLFDKLFVKLAEDMEVKSEEVTSEEFAKLPTPHHHH